MVESCALALGSKGACAGGTSTYHNGAWGPCSVVPSPDTCDKGNDNNCNGIQNEGCTVCISGKVQKCGYCGSGTETCTGGLAPGAWGPCVGESGCAPSSTQPCSPSYPYGCTGGQTCDPNTCSWDACTNHCTPFTPNTSMPGVDPSSFNTYQAGPNCFSTSVTAVGPWQVCPNGSHINKIDCQLGPGSIGTCVVTNETPNGAGLTVNSPNNCTASTTAQLVWTCIAN
jgi:hypothetical protein